jgi:hypothetical protein
MSRTKSSAIDQVRSWKEAGGMVGLTLTHRPDGKRWFDFQVARILWVCEEEGNSLISFDCQIDTFDSSPKRSFAHSDCKLVISLEDASISMQDEPKKSVTISRGDFTCVLTQVRATGFGE